MRTILFLAFVAIAMSSTAEDMHHHDMDMSAENQMQTMPGMNMGHDGIGMESHSLVELLQHHATAGTDAEPNSTPFEMLMTMRGSWTFMFHGNAFLNELQQTGPRGADKFFSTNWIMPMVQRRFGNGTVTLRAMLSFEPATISKRRYPELFQQGETAFGRSIADGQHPHDFFMELAAMYDYRVGERTLLSLYVAPVGDPAMGPVAYPHRSSASENPLATLGHHLEDSTHISDDVMTVGITHRNVRWEASGFHGREPDEFRWDIDSGKVDSWSTRLTVNLRQNWSFQYSFAHLTSPEALHPAENVQRMTASLMYNRPLRRGNWASMILWGRNRSLLDREVFNGYLAESTLRFAEKNYVWGRVENVDRTSDLLQISNAEEHFLARVQAYTFGYDHDFSFVPHLATAPGGQITVYNVPELLRPAYGTRPVGITLFIRLRPR